MTGDFFCQNSKKVPVPVSLFSTVVAVGAAPAPVPLRIRRSGQLPSFEKQVIWKTGSSKANV
jgi:hypothetical protein